MKRKNYALYLSRGAIIAALYVILTWISTLLGLSSGVIQLRISEALCVLPLFLPEAVPALFIGCIISNIMAGGVFVDVLFGSFSTLIGAALARLFCKLPEGLRPLAGLPTVISNALIIPPVLIFAYGASEGYFFILFTVFLGELISAGIFGAVLYYALKNHGIEKLM
ncbi:MAG: QueT transporter family protein [Clostridia bacterium]|nr:QueT transporter family protein [Clostridia bacterium]MBO5207405.1 QueT transporter family protein [Clostridia bacterium]